jgi:NAD(P)-dependent dehydrogenase (short-subunit alcohol dehydrogenase family)
MFKNPVVIVTGASRGLGASIALWLAKAGAALTLVARSDDALNHVAREVDGLGGLALPFCADVSDPKACGDLVQKTIERFGRLDALVNNAAMVQPLASVALADPETWRYNIEVNLMGPFYLTHASIAALRRQKGRIINVSTGAADTPLESVSAYCAAKAALNHFTRVLDAEEPAINCVAIRPGVIDTDMQTMIRREGAGTMPPSQFAYFRDIKAQGLLEPPHVPARSVAWLALHAPRKLSGMCLDYDDRRISRPARKIFGELPD